MSSPKDNKKRVHYTSSISNKHHSHDRDRDQDREHRKSRDRDSGIGSSSRASLGANDFTSDYITSTTESQRQNLRSLQEAYDAANDRIARLSEANAELDRMLRKRSEERRSYKRENEKLVDENDKLMDENERLRNEVERLRRREGSGSPKSRSSTSATTGSTSHSRTGAPSASSSTRRDRDREEQSVPVPPQVRIRQPNESSNRSRRASFSAVPLPEVPQPPSGPNPFFPESSGTPVTRLVPPAKYTVPYTPAPPPPGSGYIAANTAKPKSSTGHDGRYHAYPI